MMFAKVSAPIHLSLISVSGLLIQLWHLAARCRKSRMKILIENLKNPKPNMVNIILDIKQKKNSTRYICFCQYIKMLKTISPDPCKTNKPGLHSLSNHRIQQDLVETLHAQSLSRWVSNGANVSSATLDGVLTCWRSVVNYINTHNTSY